MRLAILSDQLTVSLGGPLPRQQADGARAPREGRALPPPLAHPTCVGAPHSVLASVSRGFPHLLDRLPTCSSPFRHSHGGTLLPPDPVRLACLIHATSVRSEPESNSQKKEFVLVRGAPRGAPGITTSFPCSLCSASLPKVPPFRGTGIAFFFSTVLLSRIERRAPRGGPFWAQRVGNIAKRPSGRKGVRRRFFKFFPDAPEPVKTAIRSA